MVKVNNVVAVRVILLRVKSCLFANRIAIWDIFCIILACLQVVLLFNVNKHEDTRAHTPTIDEHSLPSFIMAHPNKLDSFLIMSLSGCQFGIEMIHILQQDGKQ